MILITAYLSAVMLLLPATANIVQEMPKPPQYSEDALLKALEALKEGKVSLRVAENTYGVPRATLSRHLKHPPAKRTFGPSPILSVEEEAELVSWIIEMGKKGFPRKMEDVRLSIKKFLDRNPRKNPFNNNLPGVGWANAFLKRHPIIVARVSEGVTAASASVSETNIRGWFREIHQYISEKNLLDALNNPSRCFNADESGFSLCPETGKVLAQKGSKNVYSVETSSSKESLTVLYCFSASGKALNPFIVYPYKRIPDRVALSVPQSWRFDKSDNGWMTSEVFMNFIKNCFDPHLRENDIERPVILFVDGHKSHLSLDLCELCRSLDIELIALYPNATRILQPADVSAFRPLKCAWKQAVREWRNEHEEQVVNKQNFASVMLKAIAIFEKPEILVNGFKASGLFPFTPDNIDFTKCLGEDISPNTSSSSDEPQSSSCQQSAPQNLKLDTFVELVGKNTWQALETEKNESSPFKALLRIKNFLGGTNIVEQESREGNVPPKIQVNTSDPIAVIESVREEEELVEVVQEEMDGNPTAESSIERSLAEEDCRGEKIPPNVVSPIFVVESIQIDELVPVQEAAVNPNPDGNSRGAHQNIRSFLTNMPRPSRKGKRNVERLSYAVTSDEYQQSLKRKIEEKEIREKEKEERKKRKIEKREEKLSEKNLKRFANLCDTCKTCMSHSTKVCPFSHPVFSRY